MCSSQRTIHHVVVTGICMWAAHARSYAGISSRGVCDELSEASQCCADDGGMSNATKACDSHGVCGGRITAQGQESVWQMFIFCLCSPCSLLTFPLLSHPSLFLSPFTFNRPPSIPLLSSSPPPPLPLPLSSPPSPLLFSASRFSMLTKSLYYLLPPSNWVWTYVEGCSTCTPSTLYIETSRARMYSSPLSLPMATQSFVILVWPE